MLKEYLVKKEQLECNWKRNCTKTIVRVLWNGQVYQPTITEGKTTDVTLTKIEPFDTCITEDHMVKKLQVTFCQWPQKMLKRDDTREKYLEDKWSWIMWYKPKIDSDILRECPVEFSVKFWVKSIEGHNWFSETLDWPAIEGAIALNSLNSYQGIPFTWLLKGTG